jgi:hypothetical protein
MSAEKLPLFRKESGGSSPEKGKISSAIKDKAKKLSRKMKRLFKKRPDAGLKHIANFDSPPAYSKENPLMQSKWEKKRKRWKRGKEGFRNFSKIHEYKEPTGPLKQWIDRRRERSEKRNKLKILKGVEGSRPEKGKHEGPDSWKNVTKRSKGFLRELTPEAKDLAKNYPKEMNDQLRKLNPDNKKLWIWEHRKNYATAVDNIYRQEVGKSASQMLDETRQTPAYKDKLQAKINEKMANENGRKLTEKQKGRIEKKLLREEVGNQLNSQRKEYQDKLNYREGLKKYKSPSNEAIEKGIKNTPEFSKRLGEKIRDKNLISSTLNPDAREKGIAQAQQDVMNELKTERQVKEDGLAAKAVSEGEYDKALGEITSKDPNLTINDPDLVKDIAMNKAKESIKVKEAETAGKGGEKKGEGKDGEKPEGADNKGGEKKPEGETQAELNALKAENAELKGRVKDLEGKNQQLQAENEKLRAENEKIKNDLKEQITKAEKNGNEEQASLLRILLESMLAITAGAVIGATESITEEKKEN